MRWVIVEVMQRMICGGWGEGEKGGEKRGKEGEDMEIWLLVLWEDFMWY